MPGPCSASPTFREMKPEPQLTLVTTSNKRRRARGEQGALVQDRWAGSQSVQPPRETVRRFLQKWTLEQPRDAAVPRLNVYPKENPNSDPCPHVPCSIIYSSQHPAAAQVSTGSSAQEEDGVLRMFTQWNVSSAIRRKSCHLQHDGPGGIILSEVSQRHTVCSGLYVELHTRVHTHTHPTKPKSPRS